MGKGGGSSGKISFPTHMTTRHTTYMDELKVLVDAQVGAANPYTAAAAYDPDTDLAAVQTDLNTFQTTVTALAEEADFESLMDKAVSEVDAHLNTASADVDAAVTSFTTRQKTSLNKSINRVTAPFAAANSANGSAFIVAVALQELQHENDVADYRARLDIDVDHRRQEAILRSIEAMGGMKYRNLESERAVAAMRVETNRVKIIAKKEQFESDLGIDFNDTLFDINLYHHLGELLGQIHGAGYVPDKGGSGIASALGGAASGAAAGGLITGGNPIGVGIGAVLGLIGS